MKIVIRNIEISDLASLKSIEQLAAVIWEEHYTPIIGIDQVEYMLNKFQSYNSMIEQIESGYKYFVVELQSTLLGYFSIQNRGSCLFISKVYISKESRGKGIFKKIIKHIETYASNQRLIKLELTVNKYNANSISIYEHYGFEKKEEAIFDIGNGYIMDDYILQKTLMAQ